VNTFWPPTRPTKTKNRRLNRRRPAKRSVQVACRKGALGLGPNLAVAVLDLSEEGARLLLKAELPPRQEVELDLTAPGVSRPWVTMADVVRCVPVGDGTFEVGLRLRRRLSYADLSHLC
jgi:hypothetical protein